MFVRVKRIKGRDYAYLVQNTWTERGTRQKVGKYLGKVFRPQKGKNEGLTGFLKADLSGYIKENSFESIVEDLVRLELFNHELEGFTVDTKGQKVRDSKGKEIVLELNEGFLCSETLKKLLEYEKGTDEGFRLAEILLAAGIKVEKDVFIEIFGKMSNKEEEKKVAASKDFYY
ncbi:MAG: hypothetical protein GY861_08620 [bacterium]|nr:hypothetical protein [bacterium]